MNHVTLAGTDLEVSRLSFGTASLHHLPTSAQRQDLLAAAVDHGFTHFDTAPYYGFGISEWELGKCLQSRSKEITVATKFGIYPPGSPSRSTFGVWAKKILGRIRPAVSRPFTDWSLARAETSLERSLKALRRDRLDLLFLHEPEPGLLDPETLHEWLLRVQTEGKIRQWGVAGPPERYAPWLRTTHPLARVLQIPDPESQETRALLAESRRSPHFTYGCLSSASKAGFVRPLAEVLQTARARNPEGSLLVSTRKKEHLGPLVAAVD